MIRLAAVRNPAISGVTTFGELLNGPPDLVQHLKAVRARFGIPEDINDDVKTHPTRRIEDLMPAFQKRVDGPFLVDRMGLPTIRAECPRFDRWVARMEAVARRRASR